MSIEKQTDIVGLMRIGKIVAQTIGLMKAAVRPGLTTLELDQVGAKHLKAHGARSAPYVTYQYPGWTCLSINDEVAHGIPGGRVLQAGDLIKIDVSAELDGFFADAAEAVAVGEASPEVARLLAAAEEARDAGIAAAKAGQPINAIGRAAEDVARRGRYNIIRELPGHGVGRALHEPPSIPSHYLKSSAARQPLRDGMVFTVEPHLTTGGGRIYEDKDDGWTLRTRDGGLVAAFEHTIVVSGDEPVIITAL
jgi:methionyl aminopeptidase